MSEQFKIIGLSGTNGSGKDTIGQILMDHYGYFFISVTDILRDETKKRGMTINRKSSRTISIEWRKESGLAVLVDKAIELYKAQKKEYKGLVVSSLRNSGEAEKIHKLEGIVVWIDADPKIRYKRIQDNIDSRGREIEDRTSFDDFIKEEQIELYSDNPDDKTLLNTASIKNMADVSLINNENNVDALVDKVGDKLKLTRLV